MASKTLVPVTVYVHVSTRRLMDKAVAQGDFASLSEIGRVQLDAWAEGFASDHSDDVSPWPPFRHPPVFCS